MTEPEVGGFLSDTASRAAEDTDTFHGHFAIHLLGPFEIRYAGTAVEVSSWRPRVASLFKLVLTAPGRRRSRDELIDLLWPDATAGAGASNLRYTLHLLRRALSNLDPSPILFEGGWVAANPAYRWEIDLQHFEELAAATGDDLPVLEAAAEVYRGEPLPENRYEDWTMPVRERVQRTWRGLCLRLGLLYMEAGRPEEAIRRYERLLESDPLDEEVVQRLLSILSDVGRHTEALRVLKRFEARLREELDVEPMPETIALAGQMAAGRARTPAGESRPETRVQARPADVVPSYPLPAGGALVGRRHELEQLLAALPRNDVPDAAPHLVLVAAEAGMGKTRLLAEVATLARREGMLLLAGGCYEHEGRLPYGPFHDALLDYVQTQQSELLRIQFEGFLADLALVVPELRHRVPNASEPRSDDPESMRLRIFSTVAETLRHITESRPLLLLLDDLHWADSSTLQLLHFLLRQARPVRMLMLGAYREEEVAEGTPLAQLIRDARTTARADQISLAPLPLEELNQLLKERLETPLEKHLVADLHARTNGNPFFALQIARLLEESGQLLESAHGARPAPGTRIELPPAVRETIARRLRRLGPDEREVLTLGSILGREFTYAAVEAMWEEAERALFSALDAARDAHLLRETENGYGFAHPLLWEVVYHRAPRSRRAFLHERAALALERLYGNRVEEHAAELAYHFGEAGRIHLDRVLCYSLLAGDQTEQASAHQEAERHYRIAVDIARQLGDARHRAEAFAKLGGVLKAIDKPEEAIRVLDEAAALYQALDDPEAEGRVTAQLGLVHWFLHYRLSPGDTSRSRQGLRRVQSVIERLEERNAGAPSPGLAELYAALPRLLGALGRWEEELVAAERAAEVGRAIGIPAIEVAGELRRGFALRRMERADEALPAFIQTEQRAESIGDLFSVVAACSQAAGIYCQRGDVRSALLYDDRSFQAAERRGGLDQLVAGGGFEAVADSASAAGEWDRAAHYCERMLALYHSLRSDKDYPRPWLWLAELSLYRGDLEGTERYLAQAAAVAERIGDALTLRDIDVLKSERDLLEEHPKPDLERLEPLLDHREQGVSSMSVRMLLAWASAELGHAAEAQTLAESLLTKTAAMRSAPRMALATYIQGLTLSRLGHSEEAEHVLARAASAARPMPYPYVEARALYELGRTLARRRDVERARGPLQDALAIFERLGASPYIERTEQALRALSVAS